LIEAFPAAWLELREPADHRARATEALDPLLRWWSGHGASSVLDLGCGTGSNLRYLASKLTGPQRWTMVDHDADLLGRVVSPAPGVSVRVLQGDLSDAGLADVGDADLVTASALLDLVSESWLDGLVDACAQRECAALFALTYDGTVEWPASADPWDVVVRDAVNDHQRRDKGLGPALGPAAARAAAARFQERGFRTELFASPWKLSSRDALLARALIDGWERAAAELRPEDASALREWAGRRGRSTAHADFALVVGHLDLLALPPEPV
jgi:SAM-dependent methyltransferase